MDKLFPLYLAFGSHWVLSPWHSTDRFWSTKKFDIWHGKFGTAIWWSTIIVPTKKGRFWESPILRTHLLGFGMPPARPARHIWEWRNCREHHLVHFKLEVDGVQDILHNEDPDKCKSCQKVLTRSPSWDPRDSPCHTFVRCSSNMASCGIPPNHLWSFAAGKVIDSWWIFHRHVWLPESGQTVGPTPLAEEQQLGCYPLSTDQHGHMRIIALSAQAVHAAWGLERPMLLCPWNKVERYIPWSSYIHAISGVCSSHYYQGFQELWVY